MPGAWGVPSYPPITSAPCTGGAGNPPPHSCNELLTSARPVLPTLCSPKLENPGKREDPVFHPAPACVLGAAAAPHARVLRGRQRDREQNRVLLQQPGYGWQGLAPGHPRKGLIHPACAGRWVFTALQRPGER